MLKDCKAKIESYSIILFDLLIVITLKNKWYISLSDWEIEKLNSSQLWNSNWELLISFFKQELSSSELFWVDKNIEFVKFVDIKVFF